MTLLGIILGIVIILGIMMIRIYNKVVALKEDAINAEKQISVQLDRRGKIFDSLINTVKKYMEHEKDTFKTIVELRQKTMDTTDLKTIQQAENELSNLVSSGALNKSLSITMEAYPELKSSQNMLQLQEEITSTENKLSFAKQAFNDGITSYVAYIQSFPANIVIGYFPSLKKEFAYWELNETTIKTEEEKRVLF